MKKSNIVDTVTAIVDKKIAEPLNSLQDARRHSLCEVPLSENDYRCLCTWASRRLDKKSLRKLASVVPAKLGILLLQLVAETSRRDGQEGSLWAGVEKRLSPGARVYLLGPGAHPTDDFKKLIRKCVDRYNLRNVVGQPNVQEWYDTVFVQFGFTRAGMEENLPKWLTKQSVPKAIRLLLEDETLYSPSFAELWNSLKLYRRNEITAQHLRDVLKCSRWVLPDWHDDLVRNAKAQPELRDPDVEPAQQQDALQEVVAEPRLIWDAHGDPGFACEVLTLDGANLVASHYELEAPGDGGELQTIPFFRRRDGTYSPEGKSVTLPCHLPEMILRLIAPGKSAARPSLDTVGDALPPQVLTLWDPTVPVNAFDAAGRRIEDAAVFSRDRSYFLLIAHGTEVSPPQDDWYTLDGPTPPMLVRLAAPWPDELCVRDGAAREVWKPNLKKMQELRRAAWTNRVSPEVRPRQPAFCFDDELNLQLNVSDQRIKVVSAQLNGEPVDPAALRSGLRRTISPQMITGGLKLRCRLERDGESERMERDLSRWVKVKGICRYGPNGWKKLDPRSPLTVRQARREVFRVFLPDDQERVALMEGPRLCRWISRRPGPLDPACRLLGLGSPLRVKRELFDPQSPSIPSQTASSNILFEVASAVVDQGEIGEIRYDETANAYEILLARPAEPGAQHAVIWWTPGHPPRFFRGFEIVPSPDNAMWRVPCPVPELVNCSAIGIAFNGEWLGVGWCGAPRAIFDVAYRVANEPAYDFTETAAMVRWLRLPVLLERLGGSKPVFAKLARRYAADVIAAWWFDRGLPAGLKYDLSARMTAETALRQLFFDWDPTPGESSAIIGAIIAQSERPIAAGSRVAAIKWFLKRDFLYAFPQLSGQLLDHFSGFDAVEVADWDDGMRKELWKLECIRARPDDVRDWLMIEAAREVQTLSKETSTEFSETFVDNLARFALPGGKSQSWDVNSMQSNLLVALQDARFREFLAHRILNHAAFERRSTTS